MRGDFTRNTFDAHNHFSRVLMQQGRVQLDADWNEQAAILLHYLRALARDLIGPYGGNGFEITSRGNAGFQIGAGHYYVDGVLCENDTECSYTNQPDFKPESLPANNPYLVYLDVWERHITHLEGTAIREVGLGVNGPDTATRAKVVWQVKVATKRANESEIGQPGKQQSWQNFIESLWGNWLESWQSGNRGLLKAKLESSCLGNDACNVPPDSRYRGAENQLYRVEIHKGGPAGTATFKWSRDNGSIVSPVSKLAGDTITLGHWGRDRRQSLESGQWVELIDDTIALRGEAGPIGKIKVVNQEEMTVAIKWPDNTQLPTYNEADYESRHVLLRRWDHREHDPSIAGAPRFDPKTGSLFVEEAVDITTDKWLTLEYGIQVCFAKSSDNAHQYRTGDYWLIPARATTGDIEWPYPNGSAPHGVEHHYAPLAVISADTVHNLRRDLAPLAAPVP